MSPSSPQSGRIEARIGLRMMDVSSIPPIIPYGGFSPIRLQADISTLMPKAARANGHGARRSEKSIPGIMTF